MAAVSVTQFASKPDTNPGRAEGHSRPWARMVAGGAIVAGGVLLLTGWRRAGMVAAVSGTALTLLDQQDTLRSWWSLLPGFIDDVQRALNHVQGTMEEVATQRENLRQILGK